MNTSYQKKSVYQSPKMSHSSRYGNSRPMTNGSLSSQGSARSNRSNSNVSNGSHGQSSVSSYGGMAMVSPTVPSPISPVNKNGPMDIKNGNLPPKKIIKAVHSYTATNSKELSFKEGDFFFVVQELETSYLVCNPLEKSQGLVPRSCFDEVEKKKNAINIDDTNVNNGGKPSLPLPRRQASKYSQHSNSQHSNSSREDNYSRNHLDRIDTSNSRYDDGNFRSSRSPRSPINHRSPTSSHHSGSSRENERRNYDDRYYDNRRDYDDRRGYDDRRDYDDRRGYDDRRDYNDRRDYDRDYDRRRDRDYDRRDNYGRDYDDRDYERRYKDDRNYDRDYDRDYDDRNYDDRNYDDRNYDDRNYDDRNYDDRNYDDRNYDDRNYDRSRNYERDYEDEKDRKDNNSIAESERDPKFTDVESDYDIELEDQIKALNIKTFEMSKMNSSLSPKHENDTKRNNQEKKRIVGFSERVITAIVRSSEQKVIDEDDNEDMVYQLEVFKGDGQCYILYRTYKEFQKLIFSLIDQYPEEAGLSGNSKRVLPYLLPKDQINDSILDSFLQYLVQQSQNVQSSPTFIEFFEIHHSKRIGESPDDSYYNGYDDDDQDHIKENARNFSVFFDTRDDDLRPGNVFGSDRDNIKVKFVCGKDIYAIRVNSNITYDNLLSKAEGCMINSGNDTYIERISYSNEFGADTKLYGNDDLKMLMKLSYPKLIFYINKK